MKGPFWRGPVWTFLSEGIWLKYLPHTGTQLLVSPPKGFYYKQTKLLAGGHLPPLTAWSPCWECVTDTESIPHPAASWTQLPPDLFLWWPKALHNGGSLSYIFQSIVIIARFLLSREIWPIEFSLKIIFFLWKRKSNYLVLLYKKIGFIWGGRRGASFEVDHAFQNITGSLGPASDYIIDGDLPQINTEPSKNREAQE